MSDEAAFLKAIAADPEDRTARLVFADWLQERDDMRAAWVRDDAIWAWMKPDAHDPRAALASAARRGQKDALESLAKLGGHAIPAIFGVYKGAGGGQRFKLRGLLDGIGAADAVPFLVEVTGDASPDIHCLALHCLRHVAATDAAARAQIIRDLAHGDENVRYSAAWALAEVGPIGADAVPRLVELLGDKEAAWPVSRALKSIGPPGALPALPALMKLFADRKHKHWYEARLAVAAMGAAAVAPLLATVPGSSGEAFADLVGTLTDIGPKAIPELEKHAEHADPMTRQAVKEALSRLAPKMGAELLRSADVDEVARTLNHLRRHENEAAPAVPALIEILADRAQPTEFRQTAVRILGRVGERAKVAIPTLIDIFPDADFALAEQACWALDEFGRVPTATLLWLRRKPPNRRQAGIEASRARRGLYGGDRTLASRQEVYAILSRVRRPAALVAVADAAFGPDALAALSAARTDSDNDIRLVAVIGLWHLGTPDAATALVPALTDTWFAVRTQAAQALGAIGRGVPGVGPALKAAAAAERMWDVRTAIEEARQRLGS